MPCAVSRKSRHTKTSLSHRRLSCRFIIKCKRSNRNHRINAHAMHNRRISQLILFKFGIYFSANKSNKWIWKWEGKIIMPQLYDVIWLRSFEHEIAICFHSQMKRTQSKLTVNRWWRRSQYTNYISFPCLVNMWIRPQTIKSTTWSTTIHADMAGAISCVTFHFKYSFFALLQLTE